MDRKWALRGSKGWLISGLPTLGQSENGKSLRSDKTPVFGGVALEQILRSVGNFVLRYLPRYLGKQALQYSKSRSYCLQVKGASCPNIR